MIIRRTAVLFGIAGMILAPSSGAIAQDSTEKDALSLENQRISNEAARQKMTTDAIGSVKPYRGDVSLQSGAGTAESITLGEYGYSLAADKMVRRLKTSKLLKDNDSIMVVFGSTPPSYGPYLAFAAAKRAVDKKLQSAHELWLHSPAPKPKKAPQGAKAQQFQLEEKFNSVFLGSPAADTSVAVFTVLAGALKPDFSLGGFSISAPNGQMSTIVYRALANCNISVSSQELQVLPATTWLDAQMAATNAAADVANTDLQAYQRALANTPNGKATELSDGMVAANQALTVAVNDYQTLYRSLYTPNDQGILPAAEVNYEQDLYGSAKAKTVLYIKSNQAATSLYTKKNIFTGYINIPTFISVTATIDYDLVQAGATPPAMTPDSAIVTTPFYRVTDVRAGLEGHLPKEHFAFKDAGGKAFASASASDVCPTGA